MGPTARVHRGKTTRGVSGAFSSESCRYKCCMHCGWTDSIIKLLLSKRLYWLGAIMYADQLSSVDGLTYQSLLLQPGVGLLGLISPWKRLLMWPKWRRAYRLSVYRRLAALWDCTHCMQLVILRVPLANCQLCEKIVTENGCRQTEFTSIFQSI